MKMRRDRIIRIRILDEKIWMLETNRNWVMFDSQPEVDQLATKQRWVLTLPAAPGE